MNVEDGYKFKLIYFYGEKLMNRCIRLVKFVTVKDHGYTSLFWITVLFDDAFKYGGSAKF
jgi:hypothetical protein